MATTTTIRADATTARNDGATVTANEATLAIGGAAPADHAHIRFNSTSGTVVPDDETIVSAQLTVKVQAQGATPINLDVWASEFGAAVAIGDYNISATNTGIADGNAAGYRVKLKQIIGTTAVVDDTGTIVVPSRFVNTASTVNAGFSDFEIRPGTGYVAGASAVTTIHGAAAVTAADKPTLVVITMTDAELAVENTYRRQAVGVDSWLAFAQETDPGTPVKGEVFLDVLDTNLDAYTETLRSQSLSRQRARPRKLAIGRSGAGGSFNFHLTPEKWVQVLPGILKLEGTTGSDPYAHEFKVAQMEDVKTYTFIQKVGDIRKVFPGAMIDSLTITAALDRPVNGSMSCQARDQFTYPGQDDGEDNEYILSSTAAYDSTDNSILSFVGAQVAFDDVEDRGLIQNFDITFRQNVRERRGLNRKRAVTSHYPLGFEVEVSFTMYFENELQLRKFEGVSAKNGPYKPGKEILFQELLFEMEGAAGATTQNISILIPKLLYETVRVPVPGEDAIMLECTGIAAYDDVTELSNVVVTVTNSEPASVFDPSTDTITVLPAPGV
jgi:hypothetical protein